MIEITQVELIEIAELAKKIRKQALHMVHKANASHIGSCFSMADLLVVLYKAILNISPERCEDPQRDRFILSKGHAAAIVYALLAELGYIPNEWLNSYNVVGARLSGHLTCDQVRGVELSTGSLGHGLSVGCGIALAGKMDKLNYRTFVLLSDGECNEGSIWEAVLFAQQKKLDNLTVIVDYNKIQSLGFTKDIMELEPFADKWRAFGWDATEINGHHYQEIYQALNNRELNHKPKVIIAHTLKGKGVSFMENQLLWHYRSPTAEQLQQAIAELESISS